MDIPKTFNNVYGVGPGTRLDAEISVYMKSQGWPVRVQVSEHHLLWDLTDEDASLYEILA